MQLNDGRLDLLPAPDADVPDEFDGAAAALVFRKVD